METVFEEGLPFLCGRNLILVSVLNRRSKHRFGKVSNQFTNHLLFVGFAKNHALTNLPTSGSFLIRWFAQKNTFFLSLHIPPVEAAITRETYGR
jgi:hypothetical protein